MTTEAAADPPLDTSSRAGQWSTGEYKLAGVGTETAGVVTRLREADPAFGLFNKLGDAGLIALAESLSQPWTDECVATLLGELDEAVRTGGNEVDCTDLSRWVRAHPNDPDAVVECASLAPPADVSVLSRLSKKGSQKRVFLANWKKGSREVVLKQLLGSLAEQDLILERELQSHPLAMRHPNVIATLPLTNGKGHKFLVEEKLPRVLKDEWRAGGIQEAATLLSDIAHALSYIHCGDQQLVHGDIKPDNIGWKDGAYILLDFGICRRACEFTRDATATGSLRTRAPELFLTDKYEDPRKADVWSLGAAVFNAVVGRFPFVDQGEEVPRISKQDRREEFEGTVRKRIQEEWQPRVMTPLSSMPQPLRGVLARVLTLDPAERVSAKDLVRLCGAKLAGFVLTAGRMVPTAEVELGQILHHLPRESVKLMPTARKQQLAERLRALKQGLRLEPAQEQGIDELLALME